MIGLASPESTVQCIGGERSQKGGDHLAKGLNGDGNRAEKSVRIRLEGDARTACCAGGDQYRQYGNAVGPAVEVLQVEAVVPDLFDCRAIVNFFSNFELDGYDRWAKNHDSIHASAHARNIELEKQ